MVERITLNSIVTLKKSELRICLFKIESAVKITHHFGKAYSEVVGVLFPAVTVPH